MEVYSTHTMDTICNDILKHILTTMLTYREQSYVLAVSPLWHCLILDNNDPQDIVDHEIVLAMKVEVEYSILMKTDCEDDCDSDCGSDCESARSHDAVSDAIITLYKYLARPECRCIFIHPGHRMARYMFINKSTRHYHFSHRSSRAIAELHRKLDPHNIKLYLYTMDKYWSLTHEQVLTLTSPSHSICLCRGLQYVPIHHTLPMFFYITWCVNIKNIAM